MQILEPSPRLSQTCWQSRNRDLQTNVLDDSKTPGCCGIDEPVLHLAAQEVGLDQVQAGFRFIAVSFRKVLPEGQIPGHIYYDELFVQKCFFPKHEVLWGGWQMLQVLQPCTCQPRFSRAAIVVLSLASCLWTPFLFTATWRPECLERSTQCQPSQFLYLKVESTKFSLGFPQSPIQIVPLPNYCPCIVS